MSDKHFRGQKAHQPQHQHQRGKKEEHEKVRNLDSTQENKQQGWHQEGRSWDQQKGEKGQEQQGQGRQEWNQEGSRQEGRSWDQQKGEKGQEQNLQQGQGRQEWNQEGSRKEGRSLDQQKGEKGQGQEEFNRSRESSQPATEQGGEATGDKESTPSKKSKESIGKKEAGPQGNSQQGGQGDERKAKAQRTWVLHTETQLVDGIPITKSFLRKQRPKAVIKKEESTSEEEEVKKDVDVYLQTEIHRMHSLLFRDLKHNKSKESSAKEKDAPQSADAPDERRTAYKDAQSTRSETQRAFENARREFESAKANLDLAESEERAARDQLFFSRVL
jgi:hypothetical protein